ncbi:MAG: hypothetical protein JSS02_10650 [Planctomycetes bacterium]|nr:hypothetical protein [Planctomycetota bacterium]
MSSTKKLLVAFDPVRPDAQTSDFLIPWHRDGKPLLIGLKSGKESALGTVVFVGREITRNDLFAKLVDSGMIIANVEDSLAMIDSFLKCVQLLKIGNVARICSSSQLTNASVVRLEVVAKTPSAQLRDTTLQATRLQN